MVKMSLIVINRTVYSHKVMYKGKIYAKIFGVAHNMTSSISM